MEHWNLDKVLAIAALSHRLRLAVKNAAADFFQPGQGCRE
jgi:hypothetical protein